VEEGRVDGLRGYFLEIRFLISRLFVRAAHRVVKQRPRRIISLQPRNNNYPLPRPSVRRRRARLFLRERRTDNILRISN